MRRIGVAFTGLAVAMIMAGVGVTEPAAAKIRKGCREQQQQRVIQTGECSDIIIEDLDREFSPKRHLLYRNNSQKAKKHPHRTR